MSEELYTRAIGIIGKPYGLNGYLYVQLFTGYPDSFNKKDSVYLDERCTIKMTIQNFKNLTLRDGKKRILWKFSGVDSKEAAGNLRNSVVFRHFSNQPKLKKNTYWLDDLIKSEVFLPRNIFFGEVTDVENIANNDNLIIKKIRDGKTEIVPMTDEYIDNIDIKARKIFLKKIPEYI
jgi:16S rRNA processing protein RimM